MSRTFFCLAVGSTTRNRSRVLRGRGLSRLGGKKLKKSKEGIELVSLKDGNEDIYNKAESDYFRTKLKLRNAKVVRNHITSMQECIVDHIVRPFVCPQVCFRQSLNCFEPILEDWFNMILVTSSFSFVLE